MPCYIGKAARTITQEQITKFWHSNPDYEHQKGCYVFAIRAAKGFKPYYIGKATKNFKQEVFAPHKLQYYQQVLADQLKGTPVLFFVSLPTKKGKVNVKHIGRLEDFLIEVGVAANPDLMNIKGTKSEEWGIEGVIRGNKGQPNKSSSDFKKCMKIQN